MTFFLTNNFFILSDIIVLTHAVTAGTVKGSPATGKAYFTKNKYSEEIVDEKEEGGDE